VSIVHDPSSITEKSARVWEINGDGQVVGGGIHVHGFHDVEMFDSFPLTAQSWEVGSMNYDGDPVGVEVYAISLT
jgi:uncharacterized membrane protein